MEALALSLLPSSHPGWSLAHPGVDLCAEGMVEVHSHLGGVLLHQRVRLVAGEAAAHLWEDAQARLRLLSLPAQGLLCAGDSRLLHADGDFAGSESGVQDQVEH